MRSRRPELRHAERVLVGRGRQQVDVEPVAHGPVVSRTGLPRINAGYRKSSFTVTMECKSKSM
jgi:hypothetical protein